MNCLDNYKFTTDTACMADSKDPNKLDIYYNSIIDYCKIGDNMTKDYCQNFNNSFASTLNSYQSNKFNMNLVDDYNKWNNIWKQKGCESNLPYSVYNALVSLNSDTDKTTYITNIASSNDLNNRNLCFTGEALERNAMLYGGSCIYSQNKKFKLCQDPNGDLILYNLNKNTSKVINTAKNGNHTKMPRLTVQDDGNIVNYNRDNQAFWTTGPSSADYLVLRNDGKLISYTKNNAVVSQINFIDPFTNPDQTTIVNSDPSIADTTTDPVINAADPIITTNTIVTNSQKFTGKCDNPNDIINNPICENEFSKSYKIYLTDMNKYCKINNNIIDKDICNDLFNNQYNLNEIDTLKSSKDTTCLDINNFDNDRCIQNNVHSKTQVAKQIDICKSNPSSSKCRTIYSKYKEIDPENDFVKSANNTIMFLLLIIIALAFGIFYLFRKKRTIVINNIPANNIPVGIPVANIPVASPVTAPIETPITPVAVPIDTAPEK